MIRHFITKVYCVFFQSNEICPPLTSIQKSLPYDWRLALKRLWLERLFLSGGWPDHSKWTHIKLRRPFVSRHILQHIFSKTLHLTLAGLLGYVKFFPEMHQLHLRVWSAKHSSRQKLELKKLSLVV